MPEQSPLKINKSRKVYFVYFIILTVIVLLIASSAIIGYYWDYWSQIWKMEKYYSQRAKEAMVKIPEINALDPQKGIATAPIVIIEYADFFCLSCQALQQDMDALEKFYGPKLRVIFKGLPVSSELETKPALQAAYCAAEQNKFWEYKDLLYQKPSLLSRQKYLEYANNLNLDLANFNVCLDSQKYNSVISSNIGQAIDLQINAVPTLYINNQRVEGLLNFSSLKNIIDQILK